MLDLRWVTLNPLYWPVRREETLLMAAIYKYHPSFAHADFEVWWGNPEENYRSATLEGGDVLPIGNGNVLIGMSERTSRQAITQLAAALFAKNAAKRVIIAGMPKLRAAMHLERCSHSVTVTWSHCSPRLSIVSPHSPCGQERSRLGSK